MPIRQRLERYFEFEALGTNWRTELLAGVTTFVTMPYIIFVNPSILHDAGMPFAAVIAATCLASAVGSLLMGGLLLIAALLASPVKGAMLIGILSTTALGVACGLVQWKPRMYRFSDITATMAGALAGTSTVVNYIESAAGVVAGGRSGVTSIVTGLLFLLALFIARFLYLGAS